MLWCSQAQNHLPYFFSAHFPMCILIPLTITTYDVGTSLPKIRILLNGSWETQCTTRVAHCSRIDESINHHMLKHISIFATQRKIDVFFSEVINKNDKKNKNDNRLSTATGTTTSTNQQQWIKDNKSTTISQQQQINNDKSTTVATTTTTTTTTTTNKHVLERKTMFSPRVAGDTKVDSISPLFCAHKNRKSHGVNFYWTNLEVAKLTK